MSFEERLREYAKGNVYGQGIKQAQADVREVLNRMDTAEADLAEALRTIAWLRRDDDLQICGIEYAYYERAQVDAHLASSPRPGWTPESPTPSPA